MKVVARFTILFMLFLFTTASAALAMGEHDGCGSDCTSCHSLTAQEATKLLKDVGTVSSVKMSRVRGLYELTLEKDGKHATAYMDYAKKFLIAGQVYDIASRQVLTPQGASAAKAIIRTDVSKVPMANALIMGNPRGSKRLFVFTDPDCPFCAKLHGELKKLVAQDSDLAIYVKFFPLDMHPKAYDRARVLLGEKSLKLLDAAFAGQKLPKPGRKHPGKPIDETREYARSVGINSTPTLIYPDGRVEAGYRGADEIRKMLAKDK